MCSFFRTASFSTLKEDISLDLSTTQRVFLAIGIMGGTFLYKKIHLKKVSLLKAQPTVYLVSGMLNAILPAFYPSEAISKGAQPAEVG